MGRGDRPDDVELERRRAAEEDEGREPVARVISYFYERIYGGVYKHTRTLNDLSVDEAEAVLRDFHFGRERGVNAPSPGAAAAERCRSELSSTKSPRAESRKRANRSPAGHA